jgi:hypothetical protein
VTAHYTFNVPAGLDAGDADLIAADTAFDTAREALGATFNGLPRIDVDLSGSIANTDGLARHMRIRANVHPGWENTLVHETVHVLVDLIVGREHRDVLDHMTLFNEGLATWSEPAHRVPAERQLDENLAVATAFRRGQLDQDSLFDTDALARALDWELRYPLGARLIDALVARYGRHAPLRVLTTLNRDTFPRDLDGYELYRTAFQLAGYDLNLVLNDYAIQLRKLEDVLGKAVDDLPRLRGLLVRDGTRVGIAVPLDGTAVRDGEFVVRLRPGDDSDVDQLRTVRRTERRGPYSIAWVPPYQVAGGRVCYQIGLDAGSLAIYEPWSSLPLDAAAPAPPARKSARP